MKNFNLSGTLVLGMGVRTPDGPGLIWQAFQDRLGVVLAHDPAHVAFYHPHEVRLDPTAKLPEAIRKDRRKRRKPNDQPYFGDWK